MPGPDNSSFYEVTPWWNAESDLIYTEKPESVEVKMSKRYSTGNDYLTEDTRRDLYGQRPRTYQTRNNWLGNIYDNFSEISKGAKRLQQKHEGTQSDLQKCHLRKVPENKEVDTEWFVSPHGFMNLNEPDKIRLTSNA